MKTPAQYKSAKELSTTARLKLVAKLHMQGMSHFAIARELGYDPATAKKDVTVVTDSCREFEDLEKYLKDAIARTGELLHSFKQMEYSLKRQLDWATEWVVQLDNFGNAIYKKNEEGDNEGVLYGPRDAKLSIALMKQINEIHDKQAELLGVLNKNVDITVKLDRTEKSQILIIEAIKEAAPELQQKIVRQLKALQASETEIKRSYNQMEFEQVAVPNATRFLE